MPGLYDILAFGLETTGGHVIVRSTASPDPATCTGVIKLAQRWILEFLTELGSMVYRPTRGSSFLAEIRSGRAATEVDVFTAFSSAQATVERNLLSDETPNDPADERYGNAELLRVVTNGTRLALEIKLLSQAGTSVIIAAPAPLA